MTQQICNDCGGKKANIYALRCRSCSWEYRRANPNLESNQKKSEKLLSFWGDRPFTKLGRRAKKDRVIQEQGGKCLWCGISETWNGQPLVFQLDHISGDRSDNSRENLRGLCPNCHSQTPTFGSRSVDEAARERIVEAAKRGAKTTQEKRKKLKEEGGDTTFHHAILQALE